MFMSTHLCEHEYKDFHTWSEKHFWDTYYCRPKYVSDSNTQVKVKKKKKKLGSKNWGDQFH